MFPGFHWESSSNKTHKILVISFLVYLIAVIALTVVGISLIDLDYYTYASDEEKSEAVSSQTELIIMAGVVFAVLPVLGFFIGKSASATVAYILGGLSFPLFIVIQIIAVVIYASAGCPADAYECPL
jgi:hypothetical protein